MAKMIVLVLIIFIPLSLDIYTFWCSKRISLLCYRCLGLRTVFMEFHLAMFLLWMAGGFEVETCDGLSSVLCGSVRLGCLYASYPGEP